MTPNWCWLEEWGSRKELIIFDNGGEFNNNEMHEVASMLNIKISTLRESPWSNGLCERKHQIIDRMLEIIVEKNPHMNLKTFLA